MEDLIDVVQGILDGHRKGREYSVLKTPGR